MNGTREPEETSRLAIASLILSFTCAFVGTILGIIALTKINSSQGRLGGKNLAIAGIVLGIVMSVSCVPIMAIGSAIAIPNLLRSRQVANEAGAVAALKALVNHEEVYKAADADGNGVKDYLTSEIAGFHTTKNALGNEIKMIDVGFARADFTEMNDVCDAQPKLPSGLPSAPKAGYRYTAMKRVFNDTGEPVVINDRSSANGGTTLSPKSGLDPKAAGNTTLYGFCAYPDGYGRSGHRTFIVNQEGQVYGVDNGGKPVLDWPAAGDPTTVDAGMGRRWALAE